MRCSNQMSLVTLLLCTIPVSYVINLMKMVRSMNYWMSSVVITNVSSKILLRMEIMVSNIIVTFSLILLIWRTQGPEGVLMALTENFMSSSLVLRTSSWLHILISLYVWNLIILNWNNIKQNAWRLNMKYISHWAYCELKEKWSNIYGKS